VRRARVIVPLVLVAVVVAATAIVLAGRGSQEGDRGQRADPTAEALAFVPADALRLRTVIAGQVSSRSLSAAGEHRGARLLQGDGVAVATRGALLLVARDLTRLRRALDFRAAGLPALNPRRLRERLGGLNGPAVLRVVGDAEAFAVRLGDGVREVPWVRAVRRFAVSVRVTDDGLDARARLATDASDLVPSEVPLALGPVAPVTAGEDALTVGLRDLSHSLEFAQRAFEVADPGAFARVRAAKALIRTLGRLDLDTAVLGQLGTDSTLTSDLRAVTLRATADDNERLARALRRIRPLLRPLLRGAGLNDAEVLPEPREEYRVEEASVAVARFGLAGDSFVLTTDPAADVRRVAGAPPSSAGEPRGALSGRLRSRALRELLLRRLGLSPPAAQSLSPLGDLSFWLRAELDRLEARAELPIGR